MHPSTYLHKWNLVKKNDLLFEGSWIEVYFTSCWKLDKLIFVSLEREQTLLPGKEAERRFWFMTSLFFQLKMQLMNLIGDLNKSSKYGAFSTIVTFRSISYKVVSGCDFKVGKTSSKNETGIFLFYKESDSLRRIFLKW